jgi:DNA-binding NtrC family response regulator
LSLELQPKLLRVLEQRESKRVGGIKSNKVDLRIIAATRKDLRSEVEKGKFREDLYFRLNVVPIVAPPLRERREDIPMLIDGLVASLGGDPLQALSAATKAAMYAHDWPGNIRELRNVIERTLAVGGGVQSLLPTPAAVGKDDVFLPGLSFRDAKEQWTEQFERRYITWLLRRSEGNISRAARAADMDRKYLHKLLRKYEITERDEDPEE